MEENKIIRLYELWKEKATADDTLAQELKTFVGDEEKRNDAFYRELEFGTGGLRGVLGVGTNRMNIYTVAKASQGLASYVKNRYAKEEQKIAVSYDSRINSKRFAEVAAGVFAANGIQVYIYKELMPTPCLSYAVRRLQCASGIMITASHNSAKYNGYKVYGADGCQITTEAADCILTEIQKTDVFEGVKRISFEEGLEDKTITWIPEQVYTDYIEEVKKQTLLTDKNKKQKLDKDISIVYSPLNGTGLKPVLRVLKESGYSNITVVKEQEHPDGNFPTCPYPNPEIEDAMELGIQYAKEKQAELLLATDPDCDRVGIAVRNSVGEYKLLSGNETGILLLDYICARRIENQTMPENPIMIKTIVTMDMAERIAEHYGVRTVNVLTGFKYIGEQIGQMEKEGCESAYIFGFEESYGYLSGTYVRDKDAVDGAFLICEMFTYYKSKGISLSQKLDELYSVYGYCKNTLKSYMFEGQTGMRKMQNLMDKFRKETKEIAGEKIVHFLDYEKGIGKLPPSNVIKILLDNDCSITVRPSGTEPKLKVYLSLNAKTSEEITSHEKRIINYIDLMKEES